MGGRRQSVIRTFSTKFSFQFKSPLRTFSFEKFFFLRISRKSLTSGGFYSHSYVAFSSNVQFSFKIFIISSVRGRRSQKTAKIVLHWFRIRSLLHCPFCLLHRRLFSRFSRFYNLINITVNLHCHESLLEMAWNSSYMVWELCMPYLTCV